MQSLNLFNWIKQNEGQMVPPVGNKVIWPDRDFIVMIIKGPNNRKDFHINGGEEFFYQLKGNMVLKTYVDNKFRNVEIKEGEIFLLPPNTPHSPQRPKDSIGMVIEKRRGANEIDSFAWYCDNCMSKLYQEDFHLTDIASQFPPIFKRFYASGFNKCKNCGFELIE